jgi:hypothetical protein
MRMSVATFAAIMNLEIEERTGNPMSKSINAAAILAGLALACGGGHSQSTTTRPTPLPPVTMQADSSVAPAIAIDASGAPVIAYVENGGLSVRRWSGGAWTDVAAGLAAPAAKHPSLVFDHGAFVVGWEDSNSGVSAVRAARAEGSQWVLLGSQLNVSGVPAHSPRLASGAKGLLASYFGGNPYSQAVVTGWTGTAWSDYPVTPSQNAASAELAVRDDGTPVLAWTAPVSQAGSVTWQAAARAWNAGTAAWDIVPALTFQYSPTVLLASGAGGTLYAQTDAPGSSPMLWELPGGATAWRNVGAAPGVIGSGGGILALSGGGVAVAYLAVGNALIATWTGTVWTSIAGIGVAPIALARSADGGIAAAWLDAPMSGPPSPLEVALIAQ